MLCRNTLTAQVGNCSLCAGGGKTGDLKALQLVTAKLMLSLHHSRIPVTHRELWEGVATALYHPCFIQYLQL